MTENRSTGGEAGDHAVGACTKGKVRPRLCTYFVVLLTTVRQTIWYIAKGRAIRRVVTLFDSIEDLVAENDRRHEIDSDPDATSAIESEFHTLLVHTTVTYWHVYIVRTSCK